MGGTLPPLHCQPFIPEDPFEAIQENKDKQREVFDRYDRDDSSTIDRHEFNDLLLNHLGAGKSRKLLQQGRLLFNKYATENGHPGYDAFIDLLVAWASMRKTDMMITPFLTALQSWKKFQKDYVGDVTFDSFSLALKLVKPDITQEDLRRHFGAMDEDGGDSIDFEEFK